MTGIVPVNFGNAWMENAQNLLQFVMVLFTAEMDQMKQTAKNGSVFGHILIFNMVSDWFKLKALDHGNIGKFL